MDMNCKKVIDGCVHKYDISEVTIIDGYNVLYSGSFNRFYAECDISMHKYRNDIIMRNVAEKAMLNNSKLFLFLEQAAE